MKKYRFVQEPIDLQLKYSVDDQDHVRLDWQWSADLRIKLMLIVRQTEETENPAELLKEDRQAAVITRGMSSWYREPLTEQKQRYTLYPAYFEENGIVMVCEPGASTEWLRKKNIVWVKTFYKKLPFSEYRTVSFSTRFKYNEEALFYSLYENERLVGNYPLGTDRLIYLNKNQSIKPYAEESLIRSPPAGVSTKKSYFLELREDE